MSDDLDVGGKGRSSIELIPENLPYGRILSPKDAFIVVGEKLGLGDASVGKLIPAISNFKGDVAFKPIKSKGDGKSVGFRVVGTIKGGIVFNVPFVYEKGKYIKVDRLPSAYE